MANVYDVAARILRELGTTGTMKLQKLCYLSQGWHLDQTGDRLFEERIEAWLHGPVVPDLYAWHRQEPAIERLAVGDPDNFSDEQKSIIDAVVELYKPLSGWDLREITHEHDCWKKHKAGITERGRGNEEIAIDDMRETFKKIRADASGQVMEETREP